MGLFPGAKGDQKAPNAKRRSTQLDFSGLGPLKSTGTVGFSAFRDQEAEAARKRQARRKSSGARAPGNLMDEDSDDDDDDSPLAKMEESDDKDVKTHLAPEDANVTGELQAGIDRIRVSSPICLFSRSSATNGHEIAQAAALYGSRCCRGVWFWKVT